ncbi:IucA/IucC family protein [Streptomyces pseudogriseolus]|uniref:IucA/IucC family protein n=1 Tax=Streptomyces pseudogriseolus TaxID=36817 RepID=UPI00348E898F
MPRPTTAEAEIAEELAVVRPALLPAYTGALPGARAAVLTRLWRGLTHDPLPWVAGRAGGRSGVVLRLADGRRLEGPPADPYATDARVRAVRLDGVEYDDPARLMADLAVPHSGAFASELAHSAASLALSRAGQRDFGSPGDAAPARDWEWEQRVVDGHPFHPNCRSRPGFSVAEQLAYGPEHRPVVELGLLPVPARECLVSGVWPECLREGDRVLVPVHPWQAAHVLKRAGEGALAAHPPTAHTLTAHPLMALRTLALPEGPHVKTALSARLTSSVRDISLGSVAVSAVLSDFGQAVAERTDGLLRVTRTLGAVAAGSPDLTALLREAPAAHAGPGERVMPVAALALTDLPRFPARLARLARLALTAGLRLLDLGVALEAHGQNLLVVLSPDGEPVRLVYRDLADLRVSPARLARHGIPVPDVPDRMVTDDAVALRRKLFGSLVAGALAGTAGSGAALRTALEEAVRDLPRTADLEALLDEPIPAKALTLMRLSPGAAGDRWADLPNPLRCGTR